jgi:hypothetical protein
VISNALDIANLATSKLDIATAATTYQPIGDYLETADLSAYVTTNFDGNVRIAGTLYAGDGTGGASGIGAFASGKGGAVGDYSAAIGLGGAYGDYSFVAGWNVVASNEASIALGYRARAEHDKSIVLGAGYPTTNAWRKSPGAGTISLHAESGIHLIGALYLSDTNFAASTFSVSTGGIVTATGVRRASGETTEDYATQPWVAAYVTTNAGSGGGGWTNLAFDGTGNVLTGATATATTLTLQRGTVEGGGGTAISTNASVPTILSIANGATGTITRGTASYFFIDLTNATQTIRFDSAFDATVGASLLIEMRGTNSLTVSAGSGAVSWADNVWLRDGVTVPVVFSKPYAETNWTGWEQ